MNYEKVIMGLEGSLRQLNSAVSDYISEVKESPEGHIGRILSLDELQTGLAAILGYCVWLAVRSKSKILALAKKLLSLK